MLAEMVRGFCQESDYEVYENYTKSWTTLIGEETITTLGIVVRQDQNYFEMLYKLTRYLESNEFYDPLCELEGTDIDWLGLGPDIIVFFPNLRNL